MARRWRAGLLVLLLPFAAGAASPDDAVAHAVRAEMARQKIPGLALLVARHGETLRAEGYGLANVELGVPVRPQTVFQSGSVGKQFTAAAVLLLVESGKLGLDDTLDRYFPQAPAWWHEVSVRELLSHTAGFTDYPKGFDERRDYTEAQLLSMVQGVPAAYPPGSRWQYSNLGYLTLGILIHRVSGQFYGDVLAERIFGPLGMSTARIISEADIVPNRAAGYRRVHGELKNQEWVSPTLNSTADGSLYFTILDLAKWDAALASDRLLSAASRQAMWTVAPLKDGTPNPDAYGFGWFMHSREGHRVIEHDGAWQGFTTVISRYVDDGLSIVVLTNLDGADPQRVADRVAALYLKSDASPN